MNTRRVVIEVELPGTAEDSEILLAACRVAQDPTWINHPDQRRLLGAARVGERYYSVSRVVGGLKVTLLPPVEGE